MGDNTSILNFQQSELLIISLHGLNLRIGFKFWNLKQESTIEVSKMGSHLPCWKKIAGIGFLIIILKNLISGFGDILVSFSSGTLLCLLTFTSQVKSLTEVHPITLIFLRSVTTLAIITPVCTPSIYETEPNNTLYTAGFWRILWECFFVGRRLDIIKLINLVQIGIVRDQPPFPAGQSLQGFIANQLSTFSSGWQNPILLGFSSFLVFTQLSTLSKLSGCCQNPILIVSLFDNLRPQAIVNIIKVVRMLSKSYSDCVFVRQPSSSSNCQVVK